MTTHLTARSLHKSYARTEALNGVSLEVEHGETVAITGPSGSGKSTLLMCLAGIIRPESGDVTYDGQSLGDLSDRARTRLRRREMGIVLQFGQLVPELTATQNVALPLLLHGHGRAAARSAAGSWLDRLEAGDVADCVPGELSGGQAQRVAVARALITGPRLILADEPTAALDSVAAEHVLSQLMMMALESGTTLIMVTHDNRVAAWADREIVLSEGRTSGLAVTNGSIA